MISKFSAIVLAAKYVALEILPKSLDKVQVGRIGWEEDDLDPRPLQIFGDGFGPVVGGVITIEVNFRGIGIGLLDVL